MILSQSFFLLHSATVTCSWSGYLHCIIEITHVASRQGSLNSLTPYDILWVSFPFLQDKTTSWKIYSVLLQALSLLALSKTDFKMEASFFRGYILQLGIAIEFQDYWFLNSNDPVTCSFSLSFFLMPPVLFLLHGDKSQASFGADKKLIFR